MTTARSFVDVTPISGDVAELRPDVDRRRPVSAPAAAAAAAPIGVDATAADAAVVGATRAGAMDSDAMGSDAVVEGDEDARLLAASAAGDAQAFTAVYQRWQGPIYRFTLHMAGSESLAEDVTQEVFVTLAQEGHRFDPARGRFSSYVFAIARNLLRRRLRREGIYEPMAGDGDAGGGASLSTRGDVAQDADSDPDRAFGRQEAIQRVRRAVCALPVTFREAVVLCDLHELSYADAAAVLGCPVGTVRSRLHRGRTLLAEWLGAQRGGER